MARLYAESFAPWCEKARWALDHHRVPYDYTEHLPMIGELRLRSAARKWSGRVTVPLLVDGSSQPSTTRRSPRGTSGARS